jgi:hypothetical protein
MTAPTACGHQWVAVLEEPEPGAHEHVCLRLSPDHRAHECGCSEIELRTVPYQLGARRPEASAASTSRGY